MLRALHRLVGDGGAGRAGTAPRGACWHRLNTAASAQSGGLSQPEPSVKTPCAQPCRYCAQIYGPHRKFRVDTQSARLYTDGKRDRSNGVACPVFPREVGRVAQLVEQVTFNHWVTGSNPVALTISKPS